MPMMLADDIVVPASTAVATVDAKAPLLAIAAAAEAAAAPAPAIVAPEPAAAAPADTSDATADAALAATAAPMVVPVTADPALATCRAWGLLLLVPRDSTLVGVSLGMTVPPGSLTDPSLSTFAPEMRAACSVPSTYTMSPL